MNEMSYPISCPICGKFPTSEYKECEFCDLPCKFWNGIADIIDVLEDDESIILRNGEWCWSNGEKVF